MHPLTASELGSDFSLKKALTIGGLPFAWITSTPDDYLGAYAATYLREEVLQEGLTRNLAAFARFLETASFSQASVLNMAGVARESGIGTKAAEDYFTILEDLLIAVRLPAFTKKTKRRVVMYPKFFFFDVGVFRAIRPRGPLDSDEEAEGPALETLLLQHLRAWNDYGNLGYSISYWRTPGGEEVDFVLYGKRGFFAVEVKRSARIRAEDLKGLLQFHRYYPQANSFCFTRGRADGMKVGSKSCLWPMHSMTLQASLLRRNFVPPPTSRSLPVPALPHDAAPRVSRRELPPTTATTRLDPHAPTAH